MWQRGRLRRTLTLLLLVLTVLGSVTAQRRASGQRNYYRNGAQTCHLEVVFILDSSESAKMFLFEKQKAFVLRFSTQLSMLQAPGGTVSLRMGALQYSSSVSVDQPLSLWTDLDSFQDAISTMDYIGHGTYTSHALTNASALLLRESPAHSVGVLLLMTDGEDHPRSPDATAAAAQVKARGVKVFTVGLSGVAQSANNNARLRAIASSPPQQFVHSLLDPNLEEKLLTEMAVSDAAGQGVTITGNKTFNNWNWPNAVIFAATVITTIGYGNIAPKTSSGRVFCIFYGLFGVPLCLTWISELGKFFGGRAKYLGQYLTKKGFSLRKAQFTCTAIFLLWGVLVHLVLPPFVFMSQEGWTYIEGLYFSFVTLTTIGFGDLVAGVEPNKEYPTLYRYFVEVWIYLGLAWLSLFFNWKVRMVIEAHKALKKRRKLRKLSLDELQHYKESHKTSLRLPPTPNDVNIFGFLSKKQEGYNDLIKQIGSKKDSGPNGSAIKGINRVKSKDMGRSHSCNDAPVFNGHTILSLDRSPRQKRRYSFSDRVTVAFSKSKNYLLGSDSGLLLPEDHVEGEIGADPIFENQLDKDVDVEHGGVGDSSKRTWDNKEYHALTIQNANITFIDEENFLGDNLEEEEEDNDSKAKLSVTTCDENIETNSKEAQGSESEESVFTSDCSEHCHSYEKLVEEYSKEDNTDT